MAEETKNPKLAAVEAELASDRGEVYDPNTDAFHEVHTLAHERDVNTLISQASAKANHAPARKGGLAKEISFGWLTKLFSRKKAQAKKDYKYEFDPKTGGQRRVYMVRDGRTDREKD